MKLIRKILLLLVAVVLICLALLVLNEFKALGPYRLVGYDPGEVLVREDVWLGESATFVRKTLNIDRATHRIVVQFLLPKDLEKITGNPWPPYEFVANEVVWTWPFEGVCRISPLDPKSGEKDRTVGITPGMSSGSLAAGHLVVYGSGQDCTCFSLFLDSKPDKPLPEKAVFELSLKLTEKARSAGKLPCKVFVRKNPDLKGFMFIDTRTR